MCALAKVDLAPNAPVLLQSHNNAVTARYVGQFSGGLRSTPAGPKDEDISIVVRASYFMNIVALLDDDEEAVLATDKDGGLLMRAKSTRMALAHMTTEVPELILPGKALAQVSMDLLLEEYKVAAAFVAKSMQRPVFTNVRLTFDADHIDIETSDGFSLLYRVSVPCLKGPREPVEVIVPTYDFQLGLELCAGGIGRIGYNGNLIALAGPNGEKFNLAVYAGAKWPQNKRMLVDPDAAELHIPGRTLKRVISAAAVLGGFRNLHLTPTSRGTTRLSFDGEGGGFSTTVQGAIFKEDIFDIGSLDLLAELGEDLRFHLGLDVPLYVERPASAKPRRLQRQAWVIGVVQS